MAGERCDTTVGEVCKVFDGPHATPTRRDNGPVFLGITSLNKGRIDLAASDHVSEEDFAKWTRRVTPRAGDVVFSYETKLGEAALIPEGLRCCLGRRMGLMRPDPEKLDSRFLLYYYLGPDFQNIIRERTIHGSTVERIALIEFPKFPLRIPPLPTQRAIASILGALDDKIELNRRMTTTLEGMARALFQSWFVDFDPVRAKLDGRQPTGMDAETAALFPAEFEESELGLIPKGWKSAELGQIADVIDCLHSKKPERCSAGELYLQLNNIRDNGLIDFADSFFISAEDYRKWISRMEATAGDCVITNVGRVGAVGQIPEGVKAALGRNITGIRCKADFPFPTFLIECLLSEAMREEIRLKTDTGTILDALNVKSIPKLKFTYPSPEIASCFERLTRPLRLRMEKNLSESRTLAAVRDTLLPKLLSGEVKVSGSE
jgi:type I restriction enzyme S subunit